MLLKRASRALPSLLLGLVVAYCGKDGAGPGTLRPAAIVLISGNGQSGTVGQNLTRPLVVQVTTSDGRGVPNVAVQWAVTAGGGSLTAASTQTDPTGVATVIWSVGTTAGVNNQTATASVVGVNGSVGFTASAVAAPPSQIALVAGNNQAGTVGQALPQALTVRVADPYNNPVSAATVTWASGAGGGSVSAPTTPTDAAGQASVTWTLGPAAGPQAATASVTGLTGSPVTFTAQAAAGVATQLILASGNNQTGTVGQALTLPLVVSAQDAFGNARSGVAVTWAVTAGGGSVSTASATTDALGQASVSWTLGTSAAAAQTATATSPGLTGSPVTFSASAAAAAASQIAQCGGDAQVGIVGSPLPQPLAVCVTDSFGNPVVGVTVTWGITAGGGTLGSTTSVTDASGKATNTMTLGPTAGTVAVSAAAPGLAGSPITFSATAGAAAAAALGLVSGDGQSGPAGAPLVSPFVVRVTDAFGNAVSGTSVAWAVTAGGGSVTPAASLSDSSGLAAAVLTLGTTPGTNNSAASAAAAGLTGSPVTFTASVQPAAASQIAIISGDAQSATVGQSLAQPLVVRVTDAFGNPVGGVVVSWSVISGGGSLSSGSTTSDAAGEASVTWTLGVTAGPQSASASAAGLTGSPAVFAAGATAAAAARIGPLSGDAQSGPVSTTLPTPLVVRVTDAFGNPVTAAAVTWVVTAGGGTIAPSLTSTDAAGLASATLTLGTTAGANTNTVTATAAGLTGSPVPFTATATAGAPAQLTRVSGDNQAGLVGLALANPFVVRVTDAFGNPVSGAGVAWTVIAGGGSIAPATTPTDASGLASATLTLGGSAGTNNNSATGSVAGLAGSPVTFAASANPSAAAQLAHAPGGGGDGQSATVGQALALPLVAAVTDAYGNPVAGVTVTWAVTSGGGAISVGATVTDAAGLASVSWTLGPVAGAQTVQASASGLIGSPISFGATATAAAAAQIAFFSGANQSGTVGAALANPLVVRVTDVFGNPVAGTAVAWAVTAGGGSLAPVAPATDAAGLAAAVLTLGSAAGSSNNGATASVPGLAGSPVSFTASAAAAAPNQLDIISGSGQSGTVGTALASPFVVRVTDAFGNPVSGVVVAWAVTAGGGSIVPATPVTDVAGHASATLTLGPTAGAGNHSATATATGLTGSPGTFTSSATADAAAQVTPVSGGAQSGPAGQPLPQPLVVTVEDQYGNPVGGVPVVWLVTGGAGSLSSDTTLSDAAGQAAVTWTLGTAAGSQTASAGADGLAGSPVGFAATATAGAAAQIALVSGDGQTGTVGAALASALVVRVTDALGNPVSGAPVTWAVTAGGGSITQAASTSDAAGRASATFTLGTTAGTTNHSATASAGGLLGSPVTFTASAVAGAAEQIITVSGGGQAGTVGATLGSPFVVRVTDIFGNPVVSVAVSWAVTSGGGSIAAATPATDGVGLASATLTLGTTAGTNTHAVTASAPGLAGSPVTFTASANPAAAAQLSLVSGNTQTDTVGQPLADSLVVLVADQYGNPVSGVTVDWAVTTGGGTLSAAAVATDAAGLSRVRWTLGTVAGAVQNVTASAAGLAGSPVSFAATTVAGAAAQLALVSGDNQSATAGTALPAPFVVLVTDDFGNPVAGTTVDWAVTGGGGSIDPPSGVSDAGGHASATLTLGPGAGTDNNTATASVTGLTGSPVTFTASANSATATQIVVVSGDGQTATVGQALASPLVIEVRDGSNTPVSGVTVSFNVTSGGGSVSASHAVTDGLGQASVTWTLGGAAGLQSVDAGAGGLGTVSFTATGTTGPAAAIALVSGNGQSGVVNTLLASPFVVRVVDVFGNGVSGVSVSWAVTGGGGSIAPAAPTTDGSGLVEAALTLGTVAGSGNNTVTASGSGLSGSPVTFAASAAAGVATQLTLVSGDAQSGTVNTALASPFFVKVSDAFGNAKSGITVSWAVIGGGGSIAASSVTNAAGQAGATLTLGTAAGTGNNAATASVGGLAGSPVTFSASATPASAAALALVSGDGQTGTVGQALPNPIVVRVTDAFGNGVAGVTVSWGVMAGGGAITPSSVTDGAGEASATLTLGPTAGASGNSATASVNGLSGSPVAVSASATAGPAAAVAMVSGNGQTATVVTALGNPFVVHVTDAFGNDVAGVSVTWTVTAGGGSLSVASATTDGVGQASATLTLGTAAGTNNQIATATVAGASGSPVTFTASATHGAATQLALLSGDNQSGTVNAALASPLTVRVSDVYGNGVSGVAVSWAVTAGGGAIVPTTSTTNAAGQAAASLTLGTIAGAANNSATATATGLAGSPVTFAASANASAATQLTLVSGDNQSATVNTTLSSPYVVKVGDAFGNAVAGVAITWTVTGGGGTLSVPTSATDASGLASASRTLGTAAGVGNQTATATVAGLGGSPVTFTASAAAGPAVQIALFAGNNQSGTVGTALASPLVVLVTDVFGNPTSGETVTWTVTGGGGSLSVPSSVTDAAGQAAVTLTLGAAAGTNNNAVSGALSGSPVTFTASATAGPASQIAMVTGDGQAGAVAQTLAQPLVVVVNDTFGNAVSGVPVTWVVTAGGGGVSTGTVASDGAGQAAVSWTLGTTAGTNTVAASAAGLAGSPVTFSAMGNTGAAALISMVSGNAQSGTVAAALPDSLVVRVSDAYANPVGGVAVTWAATAGGGGATVTPAAPATDAAGLAWAHLTLGSAAGADRDTVTATATGLGGSPVVFTASASAAAAAQVTLSTGDGQTAPAGTALPVALAVLVRDAYGNPVPGTTVAWAAASGGGSVSAATTLTDAGGIASIMRTLGPAAGPQSTTATVGGGGGGVAGSPVTFTATATPNGTISGTITTTGGFLATAPASLTLASADATAVAVPEAERLRGRAWRDEVTLTASAATAPSNATPRYVPDELIVTYRSAALAAPPLGSAALVAPATAQRVTRAIRTRLAGRVAAGRLKAVGVSPAILAARVKVADPSRLDDVLLELRGDPAVATVSRNALAFADATTPSDPLYFWQAWAYEMMDLPRAWDLTTGSSTVLVAVIDDGIRFDHPALAANLTSDGYDFASDLTVNKCGGGTISNAGDGDGYDTDPTIPASYTYNSGSGCANGPDAIGGHGLHVAGTIGAVGNDGLGTTGVNWTVSIRPVRVLGVAGVGTTYDIAQGILYAAGLPADNGAGGTVTAPTAARIINLSLGTPTGSPDLQNAVTAAANAGVLLVASAGNTASSAANYPSAYPEVISVSAVGPDGLLASYSSFGSTVDLSAPGGDIADGDVTFGIYSTSWSFSGSAPVYAIGQGTSMAAPHVSGAAALLLAQTPSLSAAQLRARLEGYAVDAGAPGRDDQYGNGIVNARNALTQSLAPPRQLYARLMLATTGAVVQTVAVAGNGSYAFTALPDGDYYVYAGEDENGDGRVGVPGRRWGAYGGSGKPTAVTVAGAGTYARSFAVALPLEAEPNGGTSAADVLPVGGYLNGSFSSLFESDFSRLRIATAGTYTIETSGQRGACGFALEEDTQIQLYDANLAPLQENDDIGGLNYCSRITRVLTPGLYYLEVSGVYGLRYRVQLRAGP